MGTRLQKIAFLITVFISHVTSAYQFNVDDPYGGRSVHFMRLEDDGGYTFNYDIYDPFGGNNGRWETMDSNGVRRGGYTITDANGITRRVEYIADELGFRAIVNSNEPGIVATPAADVVYVTHNSGFTGSRGAASIQTATRRVPGHPRQQFGKSGAFRKPSSSRASNFAGGQLLQPPFASTAPRPVRIPATGSAAKPGATAKFVQKSTRVIEAETESNASPSDTSPIESEENREYLVPQITSATEPVKSVVRYVPGMGLPSRVHPLQAPHRRILRTH